MLKTMTDVEVARFFGKRAGGLLAETTDVLARVGIAPICVTSSVAKLTGARYNSGGMPLPLPLVEQIGDLPIKIAFKREVVHSPRQDGSALVHLGELGGITNDSEYVFADLAQFLIGQQLVRVSCRGTRHVFRRTLKGWSYERFEAVQSTSRPTHRQSRARR